MPDQTSIDQSEPRKSSIKVFNVFFVTTGVRVRYSIIMKNAKYQGILIYKLWNKIFNSLPEDIRCKFELDRTLNQIKESVATGDKHQT